jgi:hypothetical protein
VKTLIECFGVQLRGGRLVGRRVQAPQQGHPDEDAARAIGLAGSGWDGVALMHSTSWRWDADADALVLTYLCCPDPRPNAESGELVIVARPDGSPENPSRPSPKELSHGVVLHHGVGHLAWLAEHHPLLAEAARSALPQMWDAILATTPTRAGQITQSA